MKIIAELGSNWKSFDDCKDAIGLAKSCGADAIKFQLFTHKELYGFDGEMAGELPRDWLPKLKEKSDAVGIEFMCSAFSPNGILAVDPLVNTHKLASSEMCHVGMLSALSKTGKHILISTGAQSQNDIQSACDFMRDCNVTFMYCEASYPAQSVDLRKLALLEQLVGSPVGFSDHTTDIFNIPALARDYGAIVLEKHFNPFNYKDTPDAGHSLGVNAFQEMAYNVKADHVCVLGPTGSEKEMLTTHKRRLVALRKIEVGDPFLLNINFGVYRAKTEMIDAAHPSLAMRIHDTISEKSFEPGQGICL